MAKAKPDPPAQPWYRRLLALLTGAKPAHPRTPDAARKSRWQVSGGKSAAQRGSAPGAESPGEDAEGTADAGLDDVLENVDLDALLEHAGFEPSEQPSEPARAEAAPAVASVPPGEAPRASVASASTAQEQRVPAPPSVPQASAPAAPPAPAAKKPAASVAPRALATAPAPAKEHPRAKPSKRWSIGSLFGFLRPRRSAKGGPASPASSPSGSGASGGSNLDVLLSGVHEQLPKEKPSPASPSSKDSPKADAGKSEKTKAKNESASGGDFQSAGGQFIRKERRGSLESLENAPSLLPKTQPEEPQQVISLAKEPTEQEKRRQREDEAALKEQAEKKRKEEEKRRAKEIEDAKKAPPPPKIIVRKSSSTWKNPITGIVNGIKHFGMGKEKNLIIENLATMLNAGLPLVDSLKTLRLETRGRGSRALIQRILERVESGTPLWRAMEQEEFFSPDALALVRIGEEAGNLAENMEYLAIQQEKDEALRSKVKMAMIYPAIVFVLMFIIIMGLGMFVLPNLVQVLFSLNVQLPLVTRIVIAFTELFSKHGSVIMPGSILFFVIFAILVKYTPLQIAFQWVTFRIPGIGALLWEATIARFGVIVGGLLQAGVPLVDALRSLVEVTNTVAYQRFYQRLLEHILVGDSFSKSFAAMKGSEKLLPISVQQLVMTGERTGTLSKIMLKIASIYERKANDTAQKLPVILEPMLLLFIGALVGTIAFAIIIPIYSIVGSVNR